MTTEEAIKALKWKVVYAKDIGESYTDCVNVEALDTIIKALEGRSQGDPISRSALKETIVEPLNVNDAGKNDWYEGYYTAKNEDVYYIDNAPPVSGRYDEGYAQGYIDGSTGADWGEIK